MAQHKRLTRSLKALYCPHRGNHTMWGYERGTGIATLYCCHCDKSILKVPADDMPPEFLENIRKNNREDDDGN